MSNYLRLDLPLLVLTYFLHFPSPEHVDPPIHVRVEAGRME